MRLVLVSNFIFFVNILFAQTETFKLKLSFKEGDKYLIETETVSETTQDVTGEIQNIKKKDIYNYFYEIINVPNDTCFYIKITVSAYKTEINVNDQLINSFDSDSVYDDENQLSNIYEALMNSNVYVLLNQSGKAERIDSIENMYQTYRQIFNKTLEELKEFKNLFGKSYFTGLVSFLTFPQSEFSINDNWNTSDTLHSGILSLHDYIYTLTQVDQNSIFIKEKASVSTDRFKDNMMNNMFLNYNLTGNMTGTVTIDKITNMINRSQEFINASGEVSMKYNKHSNPAYTWPITIKNRITRKATKIN